MATRRLEARVQMKLEDGGQSSLPARQGDGEAM